MYKIYSVEEYHHDKDAWTFVGDFISPEDAEKVANELGKQNPNSSFRIFQKEIIGTYDNFLNFVNSA